MTNVEFHLQLNHNDTWNMSRLHFHDHCELLLPLTSPGNIFVSDQVYPLRRGTLYLIGENTLHRTMATGFHARYVLHISRKALAELRQRKDVRWTYISPAGDFQAEGERTGRYLLGGEELTLNSRGESIISYADYAIAMVDEAVKGHHDQQRISVVRA